MTDRKEIESAWEMFDNELAGCCIPKISFTKEEANGVCRECGRATLDGEGLSCAYSPIVCKTCNAAPCDRSC